MLDFQTREIPGEQWSLTFRNYDEYLHEHHWAGNPNYNRGLDAAEIIWEEMEKRRPRVILDMACGTGFLSLPRQSGQLRILSKNIISLSEPMASSMPSPPSRMLFMETLNIHDIFKSVSISGSDNPVSHLLTACG